MDEDDDQNDQSQGVLGSSNGSGSIISIKIKKKDNNYISVRMRKSKGTISPIFSPIKLIIVIIFTVICLILSYFIEDSIGVIKELFRFSNSVAVISISINTFNSLNPFGLNYGPPNFISVKISRAQANPVYDILFQEQIKEFYNSPKIKEYLSDRFT